MDARLRHRPSDAATLKREAETLLRLGFEVEDVAAAFQMPARAVADLLARYTSTPSTNTTQENPR